MSFISIQFILFLLVVFVIYYLPIKKALFQNFVLLIASMTFILLYDKAMIVTFFVTILFTYIAGIWIQKSNKKKLALIISISIDLLILLLLKYSSFFAQYPILSIVGNATSGLIDKYSLFLPLGISFYTLALIGYLVDIYRKKIIPENDIINFMTFASYFPHILQGPIARYEKFANQLRNYRKFDYDRMVDSFQLILWGYIKKMIIADRAAIFVNAVYENDFTGNGTVAFIASLLYTIQIYSDFSGCVDIALGVSKLLGIELMENFSTPYLSASSKEFWRRWHISLSSWFKDYVYIPLGGNRKGSFRKGINVLIVFLISGFWHGVGMHFIVWGLIHGIYQIIGDFWKPIKEKLNAKLVKYGWNQHTFDIIVTFNLVNIAWIFFRSSNVTQAFGIIKNIVTAQNISSLFDGTLFNYGLSEKSFFVLIFFIILLIIVDVCQYLGMDIGLWIKQRFVLLRWGIWITGIMCVVVLGIYGTKYNAADFIYMKF